MDWTWLLPLYRGVFLSISRLAFFAFSSCLIARSFFESPNQACLPARTSGVNHRALEPSQWPRQTGGCPPGRSPTIPDAPKGGRKEFRTRRNEMNRARRMFLQSTATLSAGLIAAAKALATGQNQQMQAMPGMPHSQHKMPAVKSGSSGPIATLPVQTPDVPDLPYEMDRGVKVFRLRAEPVQRKLVPFRNMTVWGYNGSCPGPTIQVREGDRVRIIFENGLPEATTIHWHGIEVPIEMDGAPYISQMPVAPGEKFAYEFTLHQEGTFFYHAHSAMQEMMGQIGMFIIHPEKPYKPHVDHDFGIVLQEWAILPGLDVPNTANMEFNWLTFNGVAAPATTPMIVRQGNRVRLRIVNLGMDHHPIHLHGHQFYVTGTEGGRAPDSTWYPTNTVLVGVAQAKVVEFEAKFNGDWMIHCHLPHHMMNRDRKSTRLNSHLGISYAVFCLKKKNSPHAPRLRPRSAPRRRRTPPTPPPSSPARPRSPGSPRTPLRSGPAESATFPTPRHRPMA